MCLKRNGRLATFNLVDNNMKVNNKTVVYARHIPYRCVWLGLVKDYVHWIVPKSNTLPFGI